MSKKTISQYVYDDLRYLREHVNNFLAADSVDLENYIYHLMNDHGNTNRTLARRIAFLRTFYQFLEEKGFRGENPAKALKFPKAHERPVSFLSEDTIRELLKVTEYERDRLIIEILFLQGLRLSELLALKKSDIDLKNSKLLVNGKGNKIRVLPLNNSLRNKL